MMTLRKLRVWHWKVRGELREQEKQAMDAGFPLLAAKYREFADFHIGCVQVLNDAVLMEFGGAEWTTAEQDAENGL
jgi:hypothetical protein